MARGSIFLLGALTLFKKQVLINFVSESCCATQSHIVIVTNKVNVSSNLCSQVSKDPVYAVFPLLKDTIMMLIQQA